VLPVDELYNSRGTVLTNIFHAALLHTFSFHSIVKNTLIKEIQTKDFKPQ
jgi:hypothetical protein